MEEMEEEWRMEVPSALSPVWITTTEEESAIKRT